MDRSPFLVRQRVKLHDRFGGYFEHVVDHDVPRIAAFRKEVNSRAQQCLRTCATHARQHNGPGVDGLRSDQRAKVASVFGDENEIVLRAALCGVFVVGVLMFVCRVEAL